jgi:hypothetical protein
MLKSRKATKPRIHKVSDAYQDYAGKILYDNQDFWGKRGYAIKNRYIYKKAGDKVIEITSHDKYRDIVENFFKAACTSLIEGKKLNLMYNSGYLFIKRVERSFKHPSIDWGGSNKFKQQLIDEGRTPLQGDNGGVPWLVYYTDDEYYRLAWIKPNVGLKHTKFYKFVPARGRPGNEGFREQMSALIKARPELKDRYQYYTIKEGRVS